MREVKSNLTEEISRYIGNTPLNVAEAYPIKSYRKLVEQVAKLAFFNKDHLLFFRGQTEDFRNKNNASTFYPTIYRGDYIPQREIVHRFDLLSEACRQLKNLFESSKISGHQELARKRYIQWSLLQHYTVCDTPLLDFTHSLRVACSFAQLFSTGPKGYVYVFGLPYMTNRISINSEHDLVNIRLLSISPPDALRPYFQEGYLAGTEDITTEYFSKEELDFNNRLIAKFEIPSRGKFWGPGFSMIPDSVLFPKTDRVKEICDSIKLDLKNSLLPGQLGQFMQEWTDLENEIMDKAPRKDRYVYSFRNAVNALMNSNVITDNLLSSLNQLRNFRNLVVHEPKKVNPIELEEKIRETKELRIILKKNNN